MQQTLNHQLESEKILKRLRQKLKRLNQNDWPALHRRLQAQLPVLLPLYLQLYQTRYDCYYHLEQLLLQLAQSWQQRPAPLKQRDAEHEAKPDWFNNEQMLGVACYVDLFADNLTGLEQRIAYLQQLGIRYLHLMPLFKAPEQNNDGGYAVSDYRTVAPQLGDMAQLQQLALKLDAAGITLVLDFVFNHTSDEHTWALKAKQGDPEYRDYYFIFDNEADTQTYAPYLREIFPEIRRGSFSYEPALPGYVWTTFNSFQWDLNYANPAVFNAMAAEMLFLANQGAGVLRLDALAFVWKEAGTGCENLDKAHTVIQAFNAVCRIAAPGLLFKSEAIVHPDEVVKYIAPEECQLSYNPLLMAMLWNSLATRKVRLMTESLQRKFAINPKCAWVNYIRCHDDIGWTFDDNVAWQLGINPEHHRRFLNNFYTGQFAGSFATGVPFQQNPLTGDCRVAGMLASLAGLEQASKQQDSLLKQRAIERICLLHAVIMSIGGVPLLYMGDELGVLNDYSYRNDSSKANDSRWVNRVKTQAETLALRHDMQTDAGVIYQRLQQLIQRRQSLAVLGNGDTVIHRSGNEHVFCFSRQSATDTLLVLANFSDHPQQLDGSTLPLFAGQQVSDQLAKQTLRLDSQLSLPPYQVLWLQSA